MNETVQSNIKDIIDKNDVVLFMKGTKAQPQCGFSNAVVNTLSFMNIDYKDVNILESDELRILDMHKSGELAEVLDSKNISHD